MKRLILPFIILFSLTANSLAFDLDKTLDKIKDDTKKGISVDSIAKGIEDEVMKKLDGLESRIDEKVKSYEQKLDQDFKKGLKDITSEIDVVKKLREKADRYIMIAKIISAVFSLSFLLLLFFVFRIYKRLKNLYKLMDNVRSYKDIEKRVEALEAKS